MSLGLNAGTDYGPHDEELPQQRALIAYHANCIDGFTSCWIAVTALKKAGVKVSTLGMEYNDGSTQELLAAIAGTPYDELYVVDFSLSIGVLVVLQREYPYLQVTIMDHHKTAFERYTPELEVKAGSFFEGEVSGAIIKLRNHMCGASICWHYFNPVQDGVVSIIPQIVTYVEDYDLWRFRFGDKTKWINKYLMAQYRTFRDWDRIATRMDTAGGMSKILSTGKRLQGLHDKSVLQTAQMAVPIEIGNCKGLAVHCPPKLTSDVGHVLATNSGTFGAMYTVDLVGNRIKWSLRSNGDFDVSATAMRYGGGGHKNAAGFETKLL